MQLPLILAGPILRRVEPTSVSVWVALKEEAQVELQLFHGLESDSSGSIHFTPSAPPAFLATEWTLRIGAQLHIAVVTVSNAFPAGGLFSYLLVFHHVGGTDDLKSLNQLVDTSESLALGYVPGMLPSFATAPDVLENLVILHGSCRKPHGSGRDGLAFADSVIKESRTNATKRPHQMFLTGDQIYADDVAAALLWELIRIGKELLGADEMVRLPDPQGLIAEGLQFPVTVENFPPDRRQALMENVAKLTSTDAASHLISFGEFCAMYLCAWSNAVWPAALQSDAILDPPGSTPPTEEYLKALGKQSEPLDHPKKRKQIFAEQTEDLQEFRKTLPAVRRALANVPVFMIFDDHEITDDWYLTRGWRNSVLAPDNPLGRAIVRNGLAAYVLFQGWGNDPASFAAPPKSILTNIAGFFPDGVTTGPDEGKTAQLENDLGFGTAPTLLFDYIVESPVHRVMVLDTRTMRGYDTDESSPALIDSGAMGLQFHLNDVPALAPLPLTIVVSPAPAFGLAVMEEWLQPAGAIYLRMGKLGADMEAWSFHVSAFENLLRSLHSLGPVVLLSGDVHYAFSTWLTYWRGSTAPRPAQRFVQLTSSALKNEVARFQSPVVGLAGAIGMQVEKVGWFPPLPVIATADPSLFPPHFRIRLREQVVPTSVWPVLSSVPAHDWSWRLRIERDQRSNFDGTPDSKPDVSSSPQLPASVLVAIITGPAFVFYSLLAGYVAEEVIKAAQRTVVMASNIGKVQFTKQGQELYVKHSLLSVRAKALDPDKPEAHVEHKILIDPITPSTEAEPTFPS